MTNLEMFERVREHLLTQGSRAINARGSCAYRGSNGLMCAVGCLIPDEAYRESMERAAIAGVLIVDGKWHGEFTFASSELARSLNDAGIPATEKTRSVLAELQYVHDKVYPGQWSEALDDLRASLIEKGMFEP